MLNIVFKISRTSLLFLIAGCTAFPSVLDRIAASDTFSTTQGFEKSFIRTSRFTLTAYSRLRHKGHPIRIYIEGDGVSWISRSRLSGDPTPYESLVLELAVMDTFDNVAYLARPGQFSSTGKPDCDPSYWSDKRFSAEVIKSMNEAVSKLVALSDSKQVHLIGYSGGAAIAILVAARRDDIASIETIAGNLDPSAVDQYHHVSSLKGSLDPMDVTDKIKNIHQRHFVGAQDTVVPVFIAQSFVRKQGVKNYGQITVVQGVSHAIGWQEHWKELLSLSTI